MTVVLAVVILFAVGGAVWLVLLETDRCQIYRRCPDQRVCDARQRCALLERWRSER